MSPQRAADRWVAVDRHGEVVRLHCTQCELVEILVVDPATLCRVVAAFLGVHPESCASGESPAPHL